MVAGIEPFRVILRLQDHRHAIVDRRHERVRLSGDERDAADAVPDGADAGERKELGVGRPKMPRLLAPGYRLPFVKAARRNEAAPTPERFAKGGPLLHRLAARIGKLVAESPAVVARNTFSFAIEAHDKDLAARTDVVARLELGCRLEAELHRHYFGMRMDLVTATHAVEVTMPIG